MISLFYKQRDQPPHCFDTGAGRCPAVMQAEYRAVPGGCGEPRDDRRRGKLPVPGDGGPHHAQQPQLSLRRAQAEPSGSVGRAEQGGRTPAASEIAAWARASSSRIARGERRYRREWVSPWLPISWPAAATWRTTSGQRRTCTPHWKKVARAPWPASTASNSGVDSLGPSSKVRAIAARSETPRQTEGPKRVEERLRTAVCHQPGCGARHPSR